MAKHRQPEPTAPPSPATLDKEAQRKRARPLPVFFWETVHVMKWMKRRCADYYIMYAHLFLEHEITGRSLVRLNDISLEKMGIKDINHREVQMMQPVAALAMLRGVVQRVNTLAARTETHDELCREILKLKLKSDILEMRDLESKGTEFSTVGMS